eukprot:PLAT13210.1.p1 GENE.PLAT13210.1~~PLAT13210.1.p1  ORF type:complete len:213 (-),score=40.16 PLAT13210.1:162-755(-)
MADEEDPLVASGGKEKTIWCRPQRLGNMRVLVGTVRKPVLVVGPDWICLCATYFVVLVPALCYVLLVARYQDGYWMLGTLVSLVVCVLSLTATACVNPGIVPRNSAQQQLDSGIVTDVLIFCRHCKSYRDRGTRHCPSCNCCVEEYDHHCVWMGTCVGKRNLVAFYAFLFSITMLLCIEVVGGVNALHHPIRYPSRH